MECIEERVDLRLTTAEQQRESARQTELLFRINHTQPQSEEYYALLRELFADNLGEGSYVAPPLNGACVGTMKIGKCTANLK